MFLSESNRALYVLFGTRKCRIGTGAVMGIAAS
jgi:hypothetical protein